MAVCRRCCFLTTLLSHAHTPDTPVPAPLHGTLLKLQWYMYMYSVPARREGDSLSWVEPFLHVEVLKVVVLGLLRYLWVILDVAVKLTPWDKVDRALSKLLTLKRGGMAQMFNTS